MKSNRRRISKMEENEFFNKLAIKMNMTDLGITKSAYYSLVEVLRDSLMNGGDCALPRLGIFQLIKYKGRNAHNIETGGLLNIPETLMMKFYPSAEMKEFWKRFDLT